MGKKGNWFGAVKKAFSPESKEKKHETGKSKHKWLFGKSKRSDHAVPLEETVTVMTEEAKFTEVEDEQNKHAYSVAVATAVAAEAAVAAAQAAAEVVRLTAVPRTPGRSKEEVAAIKIQTAFRGYLARRALRALRGLVRLKALIHGNSVKRQATTTLRCMQTLARVQAQIRSRRIRMSEENQALQRQLLLKREKELENLKASMGEDWDDSLQSKEQIEAKLASKQEAAVRRERALAYAFSHQQAWKNSSRSSNPLFVDPNNPHWGWSWLERWMAARPWENRHVIEREHSDAASSVKTAARSAAEITKPQARSEINGERPPALAVKSARPTSRVSPSTPQSKSSSIAGRARLTSPYGGWGTEEDSRSMLSAQSERTRRHSIAGSSVRDDESLASSPAVPNYMTPTQSARAKTRLSSPLGDKQDTAERTPASIKKRLSFSATEKYNTASPATGRRFSGPPKVESSLKEIDVNPEQAASNGSLR
ncbi:unnamed protein product [Victoria cruziana]